jgi:hypothetical protein
MAFLLLGVPAYAGMVVLRVPGGGSGFLRRA